MYTTAAYATQPVSGGIINPIWRSWDLCAGGRVIHKFRVYKVSINILDICMFVSVPQQHVILLVLNIIALAGVSSLTTRQSRSGELGCSLCF